MLLQKLEPMAALTVDSLRRVGLGSMITHDAPAKGGKKVRINIIKAIFRPHLVRHFSLEDSDVLKLLDRGIVKYRIRVWLDDPNNEPPKAFVNSNNNDSHSKESR